MQSRERFIEVSHEEHGYRKPDLTHEVYERELASLLAHVPTVLRPFVCSYSRHLASGGNFLEVLSYAREIIDRLAPASQALSVE